MGKTVGYDALGNITSKTGVGTYTYSGTGAGPHAVTAITGTVNGVVNPVFTYDANGNQTCEYAASGGNCTSAAARLISWTSFNMAAQITQGSTVINLTYDSEHARIKQVSGTSTTYYLNDPSSGAMSEKLVSSGVTSWHDYLLADGKIVAERISGGAPVGTPANWGSANWGAFQWSGSPTPAWLYFVLDHLGSISVITDQSGAVVTGGRLSYDAWGKRRNADGSDASSCMATTHLTTRGFTGQEEMDSICAVNLNARIYDPTLGKFLSADPIVGTPFDPQQLNRYTYVLNNPLSLTDPSGLCFLGCFWKSPIFRDIVAIVVVVVFQRYELLAEVGNFLGFTTASETLATVVNGAVLGGIAGGIATGTLKGAALGAMQGGLFAEAGNLLTPFNGAPSNILGSHTLDALVAHGLVGGLVSEVGGGSFGSGFLAAGIASLAPAPVANQPIEQTVEGTVESAVLGGFGSLLGGGKFQSGAITGAFGYLFNDCLHTSGGCWKTFKEDAGMALDWALGTGPTTRSFGPETNQTQDMKGAPGVQAARDFFYQKNAAALASGDYDQLQGVANFKASFGLSGYFGAYYDRSPTEHFVGSYSVNIAVETVNTALGPQYLLNFTLSNTSSATSFFYGHFWSWERSSFGPMGNMHQTYIWSEPLHH